MKLIELLLICYECFKINLFWEFTSDFYEHETNETISNVNMSETVFDEGEESSDYNPSPEKKEFIRNWTFERQTQLMEEWNKKKPKISNVKIQIGV